MGALGTLSTRRAQNFYAMKHKIDEIKQINYTLVAYILRKKIIKK